MTWNSKIFFPWCESEIPFYAEPCPHQSAAPPREGQPDEHMGWFVLLHEHRLQDYNITCAVLLGHVWYILSQNCSAYRRIVTTGWASLVRIKRPQNKRRHPPLFVLFMNVKRMLLNKRNWFVYCSTGSSLGRLAQHLCHNRTRRQLS